MRLVAEVVLAILVSPPDLPRDPSTRRRRPTTHTIKRRWGGEELMREAAGDGRLGPERDTRKGRRLELLCALRRAWEELGRWPSAGEWEFATREHVSRRSYTREFGSWRRARLMAARLKLPPEW
jgi:Homing endonuclease associated repeat